MKITKAGRSEHNELAGIPFKLKFNEDDCIFTKGAMIKNIAVHFEAVSERWEIKVIKYLSETEEMNSRVTFNREQFRNNIPDEYMNMKDYKLTRLLNRLIDWGYINKIEHNNYRLIRDEINEL